MRIINENFETIEESEADLSKGHLVNTKAVKEDATPIDNVEKFAWDDDDYEEVQMYVLNKDFDPPTEEQSIWDELDQAYQEGVDSV